MKRIAQTLAVIGFTISLLSIAQNTENVSDIQRHTTPKLKADAAVVVEKIAEIEPIKKYGASVKDRIVEVKTIVKPVEEESPNISEEDIELIALVTMAEAEGESELGKRLVIDTILNRMDSDLAYFPDTVYDVIYQKNAFSSVWCDRINRVEATEEVIQLVKEEIETRTSYDVMYFRTRYYSNYGTPLLVEGRHYFSSI